MGLRHRRFNSATALKPWRTAVYIAASQPSRMLQFGHGVEAVENRRRGSELGVDMTASIRPRR